MLYLEIKSGGSITLTDLERQAAEQFGAAYLIVHVLGGHIKYYLDPINDSILRFSIQTRHTVSGWRNTGSYDRPKLKRPARRSR